MSDKALRGALYAARDADPPMVGLLYLCRGQDVFRVVDAAHQRLPHELAPAPIRDTGMGDTHPQEFGEDVQLQPVHLDNQRSGRVYPRYLHPDVVTLAEGGSRLSRFLTTPNGGPQIPELLALWGPDGLELAPNLRVVE